MSSGTSTRPARRANEPDPTRATPSRSTCLLAAALAASTGVVAAVALVAPTPAHADARTDARRYFNRGMAAIDEGRFRDGVELLLQAYAIRPHPNVLFNVARAFASLNDVDNALDYFGRYLDSQPPDAAEIERVMGELRDRQRLRRTVDDGMNAIAAGRFSEGISALTRVYQERPHPNLMFNIARAYEGAGDVPRAIESYRAYLKSQPSDAATVEVRVRALEERQRREPSAREPSAREPVGPTREPPAVAAQSIDVERLADAVAKRLARNASNERVPADRGVSADRASTDRAPATDTDRALSSTTALGARLATRDGGAYDEVVFTASRRLQSALDAPNAVTILTEDDIRLSGVRTLPDLLRRVPGMDVMTMNASDQNVSMRGFNRRIANKILVMIDGRSIYLDFLGATLWAALEIDLLAIERVEVVRGPGSAIYGAYAYTGIINIITKRPEKLAGSTVQLAGGNGGTFQGSYLFGKREGPLGVRISAGFGQAFRFEREFGDRPDYTQASPEPDLSYRRARGDAVAEYHLKSGYFFAGAGVSSGQQELYGVSVLRNQYTDGFIANARVGFQSELFSVLAFWNGIRVDSSPDTFRTGLPSLGSTVDADLFVVEPVFRPSFTLLGQHNLVVGAEYRHKFIDWDYLSGSVREDFFALYAQDSWSVLPELTVLASARVDRHPLVGFLGSPRLALIWKPRPGTALRASAGTAFRQPTQAETYLDLKAPSSVAGVAVDLVGGRAALQPERIVTFELGYLQQLDFADFEVVGYLNRVNNLIIRSELVPTGITQGFDPTVGAFVGAQSFFRNDPTVYLAAGAELAGKLYPIDGLDLGASYAFQYIVDLDTGVRFTDSPMHKFTLWGQFRSQLGVDFGASMHFVSDQLWNEPRVDATKPGGFDTSPLPVPSNLVLIARVGYRLLDDKLEVALSGSNLSDIGDNRHVEHPFGNRVAARLVGSVTARF
jgi:outer membrane receptor protein involved in Fe transport